MIRVLADSGGFVWSETEQLYPIAKDSLGRELYAKEVDVGSLPNSGDKFIVHNISGLDLEKIYSVQGTCRNSVEVLQIGNAYKSTTFVVSVAVRVSDIKIGTAYNYAGYTGVIRILYAK